MSSLPALAVWRVRPTGPPAVLRRCPRCDAVRTFTSSGRFRVNANGRRLDVWLIYRCQRCKASFNREVHARVSPESLDPDRYAAYLDNCPEVARQVASQPWGVGPAPQVGFDLEGVCLAAAIQLSVPTPLPVRLDRVLAKGLARSRAQIKAAARAGRIELPGGPAGLRRPVQDGLRFEIPDPDGF